MDEEDQVSQSLVTSDSVDLLKKLLSICSNERIMAQEALKHPLFTD